MTSHGAAHTISDWMDGTRHQNEQPTHARDTRLRISMIGPFGLRHKGTSRARLLPMAQALSERGHEIKVVLPPWDSPEDSGREEQVGTVLVSSVRLPPSVPGLFGVALSYRLAMEALSFGPEVVHCFKPKAYAGMAAFVLWYAARLGVAKARLVLDTDDWEGPGGWNERVGYSGIQTAVFARQEHWGLTHCHALTVASRALETLAWSKAVPKERAFYVPNGWQDAAPKRHQRAPEVSRDRSVLLVTRFIEFDIPWLMEMWKQVVGQMPEAELSVVGKGFSGEEDLLQQIVEAEGLHRSVKYLGWLEGDDLRRRQKEANLAIFPYEDTLINRAKCSARLIELMASGLPIVASDVGQNREYIEQRLSGWLVPPRDSQAFADGVVCLLKGAELRRKLGQGAMERIRAKFGWQKLVDEVEKAYFTAMQ